MMTIGQILQLWTVALCTMVSGMTDQAKKGILHGRPFGGVAFVWNQSISRFIKVVCCDTAGRCCAIKSTPVAEQF